MITLNFHQKEIFDLIKNGKKTIETRVLNPDEPWRYFGNLKAGEIVTMKCVETGEIIEKPITDTRIFNNFDDFLKTIDLSKVFGKKISKSEARNIYYTFPGYKEALNINGVIAIYF